MLLPDVNVLVPAFRRDVPNHRQVRAWLLAELGRATPIALTPLVLTGFVRVCTNARVFNVPSDPEAALDFATHLLAQPNAVLVHPGDRYWPIFCELVCEAEARGNLVTDAHLAAIAIEHGCELVSFDRDFARFTQLRWRIPDDS